MAETQKAAGAAKRVQVSETGEIRISSTGRIPTYIEVVQEYLAKGNTKVVLSSIGNALPRAVLACETIKRRVPDLHQTTSIGTHEIKDTRESKEEGGEPVERVRQVSYIEITLSTVELEKSHSGYQPPIDQSLVSDKPPARKKPTKKPKAEGEEEEKDGETKKFNPQPRGKGKGKGGKKGKGKGKKGKGKGKKGKGKKAETE